MIPDVHVILVTGRTEDSVYPSGTGELYRRLRERYSSKIYISLWPWNTNWEFVAGLIKHYDHEHMQYVLGGYSWGVGWGIRRLVYQLKNIDPHRTIETVVSCDGIWRFIFTPSWFRIAPSVIGSAIPFNTVFPRIVIPMNVCKVRWVRQANGWPTGDKVVAENPIFTHVYDEVIIRDEEYNHFNIDEHPVFEELMDQSIKELIR